ncbi:uncharacterized protein LOC124818642 [Hydra vulgaris]|uniref:uncharacterized protein LOC124818642 n=1 Tax=Hydra vulgaris TaxID=6087 RepID=UPI0032EA0A5A
MGHTSGSQSKRILSGSQHSVGCSAARGSVRILSEADNSRMRCDSSLNTHYSDQVLQDSRASSLESRVNGNYDDSSQISFPKQYYDMNHSGGSKSKRILSGSMRSVGSSAAHCSVRTLSESDNSRIRGDSYLNTHNSDQVLQDSRASSHESRALSNYGDFIHISPPKPYTDMGYSDGSLIKRILSWAPTESFQIPENKHLKRGRDMSVPDFQDFVYTSLMQIQDALGLSNVFKKKTLNLNNISDEEINCVKPVHPPNDVYLGQIPMCTVSQIKGLDDKLENDSFNSKWKKALIKNFGAEYLRRLGHMAAGRKIMKALFSDDLRINMCYTGRVSGSVALLKTRICPAIFGVMAKIGFLDEELVKKSLQKSLYNANDKNTHSKSKQKQK